MSIRGGPADKIGNRYELRWTVFQLTELLNGKFDSIRLEPVGADSEGVEFWTSRDNIRSYHQVKRQNTARGHWKISDLQNRDVLPVMKSRLQGTHGTFTFVSTDSVENLDELCQRATGAASASEFRSKFLTSKDLRLAVGSLAQYWAVPESDLYNYLRRISIETIGEDRLQDLVEARLSSLVDAEPRTAYDILASFVQDNVYRELTSYEVWAYLGDQGFGPRDWFQDAAVVKAITNSVDSYLRSSRADSLAEDPVTRIEAQEVAAIALEGTAPIIFVSGTAGVGKSSVVAQVVEEIRDKRWPILAFRLDRLPPCHTAKDIGVKCDLPGDPVEVLDSVAQHGDCLLVVDQLDAVGQVSGRNPQMFGCVQDVVEKALLFPNMRVLVACRAFDLQNDHRFLNWMRKLEAVNVEVPPFTGSTVRSVLEGLGYRPKQIGAREIELLRLPLHLVMYVEIVSPAAVDAPSFLSTAQLYDEYWKRKQQNIRARHSSVEWTSVLDTMCDYMSKNAVLSMPENLLDEFSIVDLQLMVSENVLVHDRHRYAFFHESFFDYVFARRFDARGGSPVDLLIEHGQPLFRRAQVRQILTFQRERNWMHYLETARRLLSDGSIRLHIKQVVIAWLASLDDPHLEEWKILRPFLIDEDDAFGWGIWRPWYQSPSWFRLLDQLGTIDQWIGSEDSRYRGHVITMLASIQTEEWDRVAELIEPFVGQSDDWNSAIRHVVWRSSSSASTRYFELIGRMVDEGLFDGDDSWNSDFWALIHHLGENAVGACGLMRRFLERELTAETDRGMIPHRRLARTLGERMSPDVTLMRKLSEKAPIDFAFATLGYVLGMAALCARPNGAFPVQDDFWLIRYGDSPIDSFNEGPMVKILASALAKAAKDSPEDLESTFDILSQSDLQIAHLILIRALTECSPTLAAWSVSYLCERVERLEVGYSDAKYWAARDLISSISLELDAKTFGNLERCILSYKVRTNDRYEYGRRFGYGQWILLTALPQDCLSVAGKRRLGELRRKFGAEPAEPMKSIEMGFANSPIPAEAAVHMSDQAWLRAMEVFTSRGGKWHSGEFLGSANELSAVLRERAEVVPERFARLVLEMDKEFDSSFFVAILGGVSKGAIADDLMVEVVKYCHSLPDRPCGQAISSLVREWPKAGLPASVLEIVTWYAINGEGPYEEYAAQLEPREISNAGLNSDRGFAADAMASALFREPDRANELTESIRAMVADTSTAVRAMVAETLLALLNHDRDLAVGLFVELCSDHHVLDAWTVERFLRYGVTTHFTELREVIERAVRSESRNANLNGARISIIASLFTDEADDLVADCWTGKQPLRLGVVQVAAANVSYREHRERLSSILLEALLDPSEEVRSAACDVFSHIKEDELSSHIELLRRYLESPAREDGYDQVFRCLESATVQLPDEAIQVCERFLKEHGTAVANIQTAAAHHSAAVTTLAIRIHEQSDDEGRERALDIIDQLVSMGAYHVDKSLEEFER